MIKLIFIRHGATAGNLEKRYIGRTDEPLCGQGVKQALALKEKGFQIDRLFVSPMLRARQMAELAFPQMPYTIVEGFRELDFGIFEGKSALELSGSLEYQAWLDSMCIGPIPGGESVEGFKRRCLESFASAMKGVRESETAALVVHGGTIMSILEGLALPRRGFYDYSQANGQYIEGIYEDKFIRFA